MLIRSFDISELRPLIAWSYFYYAWGVAGADNMLTNKQDSRAALRKDAESMLNSWEGVYHTRCIIDSRPAVAEGDDIIIDGVRFPMLRQQTEPFHSLADYVKPKELQSDSEFGTTVGLFATTTDSNIPALQSNDPYERMLAQTLADRLAEATAEKVSEIMPGIRPAPGYPAMPDHSINFLLDNMLQLLQIGVELTESGMMNPHASVSGLIFNHPKAEYFNITKVGEDQLVDYAARRGFTLSEMRRFIRI